MNATAAVTNGAAEVIHHASGCVLSRREDPRSRTRTVMAPPSLPTIRYVTVPHLSVIVLVYNEAESIAPLYEELSGVLQGLDVPYEIVYVDDGSRDGSTERMAQLALHDAHVRVVSFRRNFGQTAAVQAGIDNSRGEILVFMDGDMQNDPHDIPRLLERLDEGYDVVSGWRKDRKDEASRVLPSKVATWVIAPCTSAPLNAFGCTLMAYRREDIDDVKLYGEMP